MSPCSRACLSASTGVFELPSQPLLPWCSTSLMAMRTMPSRAGAAARAAAAAGDVGMLSTSIGGEMAFAAASVAVTAAAAAAAAAAE
eukprot:410722-Prymnesium_polylepis.1